MIPAWHLLKPVSRHSVLNPLLSGMFGQACGCCYFNCLFIPNCRHSGVGRNPVTPCTTGQYRCLFQCRHWIPAFAGMTALSKRHSLIPHQKSGLSEMQSAFFMEVLIDCTITYRPVAATLRRSVLGGHGSGRGQRGRVACWRLAAASGSRAARSCRPPRPHSSGH